MPLRKMSIVSHSRFLCAHLPFVLLSDNDILARAA